MMLIGTITTDHEPGQARMFARQDLATGFWEAVIERPGGTLAPTHFSSDNLPDLIWAIDLSYSHGGGRRLRLTVGAERLLHAYQ